MNKRVRAVADRLLPRGTRRRQVVGRLVFIVRLLAGWTGAEPLAREQLRRIAASARAPKVCILSGCGGDSRRYRCDHAVEALHEVGAEAVVVPLEGTDLDKQRAELVAAFDVLVFQRACWTPQLGLLVAAARRARKLVFFETDDLTFDPFAEVHRLAGPGRLLREVDIVGQHATLRICLAACASTEFLAEALARHSCSAEVIRNGFSAEMLAGARRAVRVESPRVVIGYGSGTPTHDRDFEVAAGALAVILAKYPETELHLVGHLEPGPRLSAWRGRVVRHALVPWRELPARLARFDVNLAPFETEVAFCQAKSELKYLEAALVGVPTVASPLPAYRHAIRHGENGFLAADEAGWVAALEALVQSVELRRRVGEAARAHVLAAYAPAARGADWLRALARLRAACL